LIHIGHRRDVRATDPGPVAALRQPPADAGDAHGNRGRTFTSVRLTRAADLLRVTDLPVHEVAGLCGWASASRFSTAFRQHHGTSPTAYRATG
jgi:AraC-like DNA-binding protein